MIAVETIGVEVELPRKDKGAELDVGKDKKTRKAFYTSGLKILFFSCHH